jgi:DNA-binding NtrC family response regulator
MASVRILLIDDDADYLDSTAVFLESKGYTIQKASSGSEGIEMIKSSPVDIAFVDLKMPEMDGITTLKEIRKIYKNLPVIIVTGFADQMEVDKMNELGISGLFSKSYPLSKIEPLVDVTLRKHNKPAS